MTPSHRPERNRAGGGRLENVFGPLLVRRFMVRQPELYRVIEAVSSQGLTPIDKAALCELAQSVMDIEYNNLVGDFLQAGCGLGGASIVIAQAKHRSRVFEIYDTFGGAPDLETKVRHTLASFGTDDRLNVNLTRGPYEKTMVSNNTLAFIHLDGGDYESTHFLLGLLVPQLVSGGHLIVDDYKTREACRAAVDDFFRGKSGFQITRRSRLHVTRN